MTVILGRRILQAITSFAPLLHPPGRQPSFQVCTSLNNKATRTGQAWGEVRIFIGVPSRRKPDQLDGDPAPGESFRANRGARSDPPSPTMRSQRSCPPASATLCTPISFGLLADYIRVNIS
jgi:hypothetical protein